MKYFKMLTMLIMLKITSFAFAVQLPVIVNFFGKDKQVTINLGAAVPAPVLSHGQMEPEPFIRLLNQCRQALAHKRGLTSPDIAFLRTYFL